MLRGWWLAVAVIQVLFFFYVFLETMKEGCVFYVIQSGGLLENVHEFNVSLSAQWEATVCPLGFVLFQEQEYLCLSRSSGLGGF